MKMLAKIMPTIKQRWLEGILLVLMGNVLFLLLSSSLPLRRFSAWVDERTGSKK